MIDVAGDSQFIIFIGPRRAVVTSLQFLLFFSRCGEYNYYFLPARSAIAKSAPVLKYLTRAAAAH